MANFSNARLLGYEHKHNYLGENINFQVQKHLTVDGSIYNLTNTSGVSGVWSGISGFIQGSDNYQPIIINGTNFGSGRINNINFSEGNDVRYKNYQADITILSTGNLYNLITTGDFAGVALPN